MYRVFEKSGITCEFTAESANDESLFVKELAASVNGLSKAVAGVIVEQQSNDSGDPCLVWKSYTGQTALMKALKPKALIHQSCLLYTSPSPRDQRGSRMPSSA